MTYNFEFVLSKTLTSGSTLDCGTFNDYNFAMDSAKEELKKVSVKSVVLLDNNTGEVLFREEKEK